MALIQVGLDKWLEGQPTNPSIVTRIHSLDPRAKAQTRTLIIPAGQGSFVPVDLPVGRYLFQAFLPSGEIATKTVTVSGGANESVRLRATDSPHEWLSWQHLAARRPTKARKRAGARPSLGVAAPNPLEIVTLPVPVSKTLLGIWKGAPPNTLSPAVLTVPPRPDSRQPLRDETMGITAYLFDQGPWTRHAPGLDGERYYGLVRNPGSGPALLAALPLPWHQADMSGDAMVDVLVDSVTDRGPEWPVTVSVVVRDNVMGSVFGYLSSGDLPSAGQVVETAVNRLAAKYLNALAAAGAAYVLVASATTPKTPNKTPVWVQWLANLRNDFPSLPDGSILAGWAQLNGIGHNADVGTAATAFIEAVDRGLPLYTAGVRLLFDGMTRVAAAPKAKRPEGFDAAYEIVRRLALRIDVRQTFTVVRLS